MLKTLVIASITLFVSPVLAEVTGPQLSAACMKLDNGTSKKCDCMAKNFTGNLSQNENIYALAMLTLDGSLLVPIEGNLEDKKAEAVKAKIIPLMMDCLL